MVVSTQKRDLAVYLCTATSQVAAPIVEQLATTVLGVLDRHGSTADGEPGWSALVALLRTGSGDRGVFGEVIKVLSLLARCQDDEHPGIAELASIISCAALPARGQLLLFIPWPCCSIACLAVRSLPCCPLGRP